MLKNTSPERKRSWIWSCWCESDVAASYAERGLIQAKPWYSLYGNDLFSSTVYASNLSTANMGTSGMGINTHILGNRHYELTNHLGNVQAMVVDRPSPIIDTAQNDTLLGYHADISTAQDYYPFGMLMPGRYTSDTQKHCVTINSTVLVSKPIQIIAATPQTVGLAYQFGGSQAPPPVGQLPKANAFANEMLHVFHYNAAEEHPNGWVVQTTADEYSVEYDIDLSEEPEDISAYLQLHMDTNQTEQMVEFGITLDGESEVEMRVRQYTNEEQEEYYELLDWSAVTTSGLQELLVPVDVNAVKAGGNTILELKISSGNGLSFANGLVMKLATPKSWLIQLVPENRVVTICDEKDNYRFGFNGQEKVNEIAGIGNHTTAPFWEYDTRLGRRWNPDPITYPWQSTYATNNNNPILFTDPLGLFGTRKEARQYKKEHDISGKITKDNDGLYSINDKRNGVSYTRDNSLADAPNVLGMQADGVLRSPMITAEGKGSNSNCYTCWMYDSKNSDAFKRASEQGYMPYNPEAVGVTFSANGLYGGGGSFSLSLGISANDGLFGSYSIGGGVGNDVSLSGGFFMADYRGKGRADISGFVNGAGQQNSIGLTALSLSQSSDIFSQDGRLYYGQNWNSIGIGLGVGTRELPMGAVSATSQVTYGQGLSMRSIYNYLKSKK